MAVRLPPRLRRRRLPRRRRRRPGCRSRLGSRTPRRAVQGGMGGSLLPAGPSSLASSSGGVEFAVAGLTGWLSGRIRHSCCPPRRSGSAPEWAGPGPWVANAPADSSPRMLLHPPGDVTPGPLTILRHHQVGSVTWVSSAGHRGVTNGRIFCFVLGSAKGRSKSSRVSHSWRDIVILGVPGGAK